VQGELEEWSTIEELAAWLGVDIANLYYLAGRGKPRAGTGWARTIDTGAATSMSG
jgi:hypothetical protein